ncbi:hypothetical protein V1514DRAFT_288055 [Lipomyces japonicus]|uniref:uncharacterized protein n=1 Tax=Lipomyces japonicus TaxID=56871 RepID=UPI0034CE328E
MRLSSWAKLVARNVYTQHRPIRHPTGRRKLKLPPTYVLQFADLDEDPTSHPKLNLGQTLDTLTELLPNIQHARIPASLLSPDIQLRFFPKTHPGLPSIHGKTAYLTTWKIAQWVLPLFVLGPFGAIPEGARAVTQEDTGDIVFKVVNMRVESDSPPEYEGIETTKLLVRWEMSFEPPKSRSGPDTVVAGLFTFDFDSDGRILAHSIDDVEELHEKRKSFVKEVEARQRIEEDDEESPGRGQVVSDDRTRRNAGIRHA